MKILISNIYKIYISGHSFAHKVGLISGYVKLRFFRVLGIKIKKLKIAGILFNIQDLNEFHSLFEDIFIKEVYAFNTNNKKPCIIDVGANIGISVLYFKFVHPNAKIFAFEPLAANYAVLEKNVRENGFTDVTLFNYGLGDSSISGEKIYGRGHVATFDTDIIEFHKNRTNDFSEVTTVELRKASESIRDFGKIDLLKLDVEGSEDAILEDVDEMISSIDNFAVEYHFNRKDDRKLGNFISRLENKGYIFTFSDSPANLRELKSGDYNTFMLYAKK